ALAAVGVEHHEFGTHAHHVAGPASERHHAAGHGRRDFHGGLLGHHLGHDLVFGDVVADLHVPGHDLGFDRAFAEVGHLEYVAGHGVSITALRPPATRCGPGKYSHSNACG